MYLLGMSRRSIDTDAGPVRDNLIFLLEGCRLDSQIALQIFEKANENAQGHDGWRLRHSKQHVYSELQFLDGE